MAFNSQYLSDLNAARQAQLDRYNSISAGMNKRVTDYASASQSMLGQYADRYNRAMNYLTGYGNSQRQDLADFYTRASSQQQAAAYRQGFGASVYGALQRGAMSDYGRQLTGLAGNLAGMRANTDAQLSGDILQYGDQRARTIAGLKGDLYSFQAQRTDMYPDPSLYAPGVGGPGYRNDAAPGIGTLGSVPTPRNPYDAIGPAPAPAYGWDNAGMTAIRNYSTQLQNAGRAAQSMSGPQILGPEQFGYGGYDAGSVAGLIGGYAGAAIGGYGSTPYGGYAQTLNYGESDPYAGYYGWGSGGSGDGGDAYGGYYGWGEE